MASRFRFCLQIRPGIGERLPQIEKLYVEFYAWNLMVFIYYCKLENLYPKKSRRCLYAEFYAWNITKQVITLEIFTLT